MADTSGPWEQYRAGDSSESAADGPWRSYAPDSAKSEPPRSLARSAGDSALALGTGVVQGVKMLTDVAGADNAVSRNLGKAADALSEMESPQRKAQKQERAAKIKTAEESGSTWEEVKAHAGAFADAPIDTTLNALGTSVPTLAAAFVPGAGQAALATRVAQVGLGVAQGVGNVKGQIHEAVKRQHLEAGASEEEAQRRADEAQSYSGGNAASIALGGALGGVAGGTGAESAARQLAGRQIAKEAAEQAAPSVVRSTVGGVLKEAPIEAVQGGQERLASNLALQGDGFDVPTWQGVAGQAALEGIASAPIGGGFGAAESVQAGSRRRADVQAGQRAQDVAASANGLAEEADVQRGVQMMAGEPVNPVDRGEPATFEDLVTPLPPVEPDPYSAWEQEVAQQRVDSSAPLVSASPDTPVPELDTEALSPDERTPSQRMGLDPAAGPLSKAAATAVDSGASPAVAPVQGIPDAQATQAPLARAAEAVSPTGASAVEAAGAGPLSQPAGVNFERQTDQTQQSRPTPSSGRAASQDARTEGPLSDAPPIGNDGAQAAPATAPQGQAPSVAAAPETAGRHPNWRTSMLRAGPIAKSLGIDPKGKRTAQVVAEIDAADAQRAGVAQDGADLSAGQIDREWSAFAPETGTLGVPRANMPQIKSEHRGALVNFLKARGIDSQAAEVPANDLKPTQAEFSQAKVNKARSFVGSDRSILVSSDGYVVDGHHQWLAKRANGEPVKVIRLKAPIQKVLAQVREFPSLGNSAGATQGDTNGSARNLGPGDGRRSGPDTAEANRASQPTGGAAPVVRPGQRPQGDPGQPAPAVQPAVPDADGAGESAAPVGKEVSRDIGQFKEGMSEFRAKQVRNELARKNPKITYTVEEDDSLKNGYAVVGRQSDRAAPMFSRGKTSSMATSDVVGNTSGGRSADDTTTGASDAQPVDEDTGLPLHADGTVTVYHHTSAESAERIRKTGRLIADAEPDVYVTSRKETDTGYGDTAVALRVKPSQLILDDEFPDGRKDFRLEVGRPGGSIRVTVANESFAPDSGGAPLLSQGSSNARGQGSSAAPQTLERLRADITGMGVTLNIAERNGVLTLNRIVVPEGKRSAGVGTQAMQAIIAYADATAKHVVLSPSADFGGNKARLTAFYKRFGFVENKGRSRVQEVSESMVRENPAGRPLYSKGSMTPELAAELMKLNAPATKASVQAAVRELVNGLGVMPNRLGRVVVATSSEIKQHWEPLIGDTGMEATGDAGKAQGFYDPNTKTVFLIADHIRAGDELGVVAHELMHKHGQAVLGEGGWNQLHGAIKGWARAPEGSKERQIYREAVARVEASRPEGANAAEYSSQELFPYAVQIALEMGIKPNLLAKPGTVARWLGEVKRALRQVWEKITRKPDAFNSQDLVNLAFGIAQRENPEHVGELDGAIAPLRKAANFLQARQAVKEFQGKELTNAATGMTAVVSRGSLDKMLSSKAVEKSETPATHALAVANADNLFERAVHGWSKPDRSNDPNIRAIHRFFAPLDVNGRTKLVKLTVKESVREDRQNPLYTVEAVELNETLPGVEWIEAAAREDGVNLEKENPLQRGVGRRDSQQAGPRATLAQPRDVTPGRSAEDVRSLAQEVERRNSTIPEQQKPQFSRAAASKVGQPGSWDSPEPSRFDDWIYKMQDKHIDTKRVIEAIEKSGKAIADDQNVRMQEELFHGRAAKRVDDFADNDLKPLLEYMSGQGLTMGDVEEYLHARHAREANALIAGREAGMPDGGSGMKNADADKYLNGLAPDMRAKLEKAAAQVDAIIAETRNLYVAYGLESKDTVDGWAKQFKHYVPLMREDKDGGMGIGQGFSIKGKEVKGRTGSTRKVVDILANIAAQREKVIVRGEKNRVALAAVGLAEANPNADFWKVDEVPKERVFDPAVNKVVERPDPLFKQRDNVLVAKAVQKDGSIKERAIVFNQDDPRAMRMAEALKNLDSQQLEGVLGASAKITRYFAAVNTQWNPVFGVVNIVRDVQGAMVNLQSTPLAGQQARIAKDTLSALAGIYADLRAHRAGKTASSPWAKLFEEFQEDGGQTGYRDQFRTSADRAQAMERVLDPASWTKSGLGRVITANGTLGAPMEQARKTLAPVFNWLTDYNDAMENAVRLSAYKAARDKGMSRQQAASIAKNLTVNFNRKGQAATHMGALYAFFNAAMQGTARIGQALFTMEGGDLKTLRLSKTGKQVVMGGMLLGTLQALALSAAGFSDDDPPEFLRERSLIIPIGGKNYVAIPMPLGLHVIPGIGRHVTEFFLNGGKDPAKRLVSMAGMFADAFNPIGNAGLSMQTLAPTALDPLAALTENKDWTGNAIARKSSNAAMPGHLQGKDTSTAVGKWLAEAINSLSGGNQYVAGAFSPTPDQIDYLGAQIGGGVWREASKVSQGVQVAASGEELPPYKIPLLGRFYGNAKSQASQGTAFYASVHRLNALETEMKNMRKDNKWAEAAELRRASPEGGLIEVANYAERRVQELKRKKRELVANGASREAVRHQEELITNVMARFNDQVAQATASRR